MAPADPSWEALAKKMCASHVSVSSFHFSTGNYVDLASQSILPRHTGGQLYLYANCVPEQRDEWCAKLQAELARNLMRSYGYEGVMRVRCSKGAPCAVPPSRLPHSSTPAAHPLPATPSQGSASTST